ncbi:hypothetical protein D6777_04435 [Candidatus Woesearchaeota archaeon]|nr:MAG: hypothetical protein D6777_04435 [Candidatus Woesearchaeota archaeon]
MSRIENLAKAVVDVGGGFISDKYSAVSEVYGIVERDNKPEFVQILKIRGSRADPHRHSIYSNEVIGSGTTRILGVKESYAHVKSLLKRQALSGMDILSIQDHNVVDADKERREFETKNEMYEGKTFMSCEYDVMVPGQKSVHVGVWGLDYPFQENVRITQKDVRGLHYKLSRAKARGVDNFRKVCDQEGLIAVLNHPTWITTPKNPLSGEDLDKVSDVFDYLEINGDCQKENLFTLELALEKGKTLVAGSDLHNLRLSKVFTETIRPVNNAAEFLRAVRDGEVAIGNISSLPSVADSPIDVLRSNFNGTRLDMYNDIYRGIGNYLLRDWKNKRKLVTVATFGALMGGGYLLYAPLMVLPVLATAWLMFTFPIKYGFSEKAAVAERTHRLYMDYQDFKLRKNIQSMNGMDEEEVHERTQMLEEIVKQKKEQFINTHFRSPRRPWEAVAETLFPKELKPDYDFSKRIEGLDEQQ